MCVYIYMYEIVFPFSVKEDYIKNLGNLHNESS